MEELKFAVFNFLFEFTSKGQATEKEILDAVCPYGHKVEDVKNAMAQLVDEKEIMFSNGLYFV